MHICLTATASGGGHNASYPLQETDESAHKSQPSPPDSTRLFGLESHSELKRNNERCSHPVEAETLHEKKDEFVAGASHDIDLQKPDKFTDQPNQSVESGNCYSCHLFLHTSWCMS